MNARRRLTSALGGMGLVALLVSGVPAEAETPPAPSPGPATGINFDIDSLVRAPLGSWSDYTMAKSGTDKSVTIRYALVDKTPQKLALEIDTPIPEGEVLMRFEFAAQGGDAWKLVASRMQRGDQKMEMPKEQLEATPILKKGTPPGDFVGTEPVTIPAGTFTCRHYRSKTGDDPSAPVMDMWLSDKVSPTGLVKSSLSPLGIGMTLAATGTGQPAKTK